VRRAGHSSRGVLPSVACLKCVIVKPRRNEEAQAHIGLSSHRKKNYVPMSKHHVMKSVLVMEAILHAFYTTELQE
jgi:hypothetical protein